MKTLKIIPILAVFSCASSLFAAGPANQHIYLSRGYSTTTATGVFDAEDSGDFSDRIVYTGWNNLDEVNREVPEMFDADGYRTSQSGDATYVADGSMYLHIGYYNNGCVGSGTSVEDFILNGDLVLGRMAYENQYGSPVVATPKMTTVFTAGAKNYKLTFTNSSNGAENLFFRGGQSSNLVMDMNIHVNNDSAKQKNVFAIGGTGNSLQIGSADQERSLTIKNDAMLPVTLADKSVRNVFYMNGSNTKLTVYSNIEMEDTVTRTLLRIQSTSGNERADFYGDIDVYSIMARVNLGTEKNPDWVNSALFETRGAGQVVNVHGNLSINAGASQASTALLGTLAGGSYINFSGTIKSVRTAETSLNLGSATNKAVANFTGTESNSFSTIGLRHGVANLNKSGTAAAISGNTYIGIGSDVIINVFGKHQLDLSNAQIALWGAHNYGTDENPNRISGTINLNGSDLKVKSFYNNNGKDSRYLIVDFGMSNTGMTSAQMAASGITAGMINATGAGEAQIFSIEGGGSIDPGSGATMSFIVFKNYIIGEDRVICESQLSALGFYSISDLDANIFRFDGYMDKDKYGIDYRIEEVAVSEGWEYKLVLIPEAAEMAALFGALALGFAIYRRRK